MARPKGAHNLVTQKLVRAVEATPPGPLVERLLAVAENDGLEMEVRLEALRRSFVYLARGIVFRPDLTDKTADQIVAETSLS